MDDGEDCAVTAAGRGGAGRGGGCSGGLYRGTDVASEAVIDADSVDVSCDGASVDMADCPLAFGVADELAPGEGSFLPRSTNCRRFGVSDDFWCSAGTYFDVFDLVTDGRILASMLPRRVVSTFSVSGVFLLILVPLRTLRTSGSPAAVSGGLGGASPRRGVDAVAFLCGISRSVGSGV